MFPRNGFILGVCALAFSVVSTGCNQGQMRMTKHEDTTAPHGRADTRATFPLVRKLDQEGLDRSIELDFDVPPQATDSEPPVFIGLRVSAADPTAAAEVADRLRDAGVRAKVRLYRLGGAAPEAVAISRSQWTGRSEVQTVAVGADGLVPELFGTTADFASMHEAGLLRPDVSYKELELVFIRDTPPGRYRAVVELNDPRQILLAEKAELLIAYTAKSR
jgi:hypothetical protein